MSIKGSSVGYPLPDPRKGLSMQGSINMNQQKLHGLPAPEEDDDAVNWGSVKGVVQGHVNNKNNPHGVTAAQVGATPASHANNKNNPHGVTAEQIGALLLLHINDAGHTIPENAKLNSYTTEGVYRCATTAIASSLSNMPPYKSAGFRLIVSATSAEGGIIQIAIFNSINDRIYYRVRSNDGTWGVWRRFVTHEVGLNVELWSGSWKSGKITVPNTDKYKLFAIGMSGQGTMILAVKHSDYVRGIGGFPKKSDNILVTYDFDASFSGNSWTLDSCDSMSHTASSTHHTLNSETVTSIIGLL